MQLKKKSIFVGFLTVIILVTFTQMSMAYNYTVTTTGNGGTHSGFGPYQTGDGGEFTLLANADLQWVLNYYQNGITKNVKSLVNTFQSFCLEKNEVINANSTYDAVLNSASVKGGSGGATNNSDPISIGTAWLYSQFVTGTWSLYNYGSGRSASASALQNAIWWLEGEQGDPGSSNSFRNAVLSLYGSATAAKTDSNGAFGIQVLNLTKDGQVAQDVLVATPIPAGIWLLGAGLLGLVGFRKKAQN